MTADLAIELVRDALLLAGLLLAPVLAAIFLISLLVAVLQALTSLQDPTVSLLPRLLIGGLTLVCLLPWMMERLTDFTTGLYQGAVRGW